jgi:DNA (cytosine-5)-methyltransferase 1
MDIVLIDLFAGMGGFHLGLENAGYNITHSYFSEIDLHAIANYKYNFPNAEYIGSVTDVRGATIRERHPEAKIFITFGWPCQDNSIAGKRKGHGGGTRSALLFEAIRIISEVKPECFIAENVKGLYSVNEGIDFYEAIRFLTYLNSDSPQYTVEMQLFNSSWIIPQNRERVYFIGHLGTRGVKRILPITENDIGSNEGPVDTTNVRTITGGGALRRDAQLNDITSCVNDRGKIRDTDIANCIDANYWKGHDNHGARTLIRDK